MLKRLSVQVSFILLFICLLASSAAAAEVGLVPTKLPVPSGSVYSTAMEMNDNGQAIGYVYDANWQNNKAIFWSQNQAIIMGVMTGSTAMYPRHLNNNGQVIGTDNNNTGWIWENGVYTNLGKLNVNDKYTIPQFLNNQGMVAGISYDLNYKISSWVWQNGQFTKLADVPGTNNNQVRGLNDSGQLIGLSYDSNYVYKPWIWQNNQYTYLVGLSGSTQSYPQFINNQGDVIGSSYVSNTNKYWIWKQGHLKEITGIYGKPNTQVQGLNNQGQVLGLSYDQNWNTRQAWIMTNGQYTEILNFKGIVNTNVNTLNDLGQVVGTSYDSNYAPYSWVWSNGVFTSLEKLPGTSNTYVNQARDMMMYDYRKIMSNTQLLGSADNSAIIWTLGAQAPQKVTTPILTANKTVITNSNVQITIEYSANASQKLYRIGNGAWTAYTTPLSISVNGTIEAKGVSASGIESEIASYVVTNIDKVAPTATVAYSTTGPTNQNVLATITPSEQVTITNNNGLTSYTFSENGTTSFTFVDAAGNVGTVTATVSNIDKIAPTITYTGNANIYNVDQVVTITCSVDDNLSGVLSNTCVNITGPAYSFITGINTYTSTAVDNAGNTVTSTISFTVVVNASGMQDLTSQFVTDAGIASSLNAKLAGVATSNANAKAGKVNAFINQVRAQTGKAITTKQADILINLAGSL